MKWTDRDIKKVRKMYKQGKSYREIGMALGRTRGMVAGVIGRMRLAEKPPKIKRYVEPTWIRLARYEIGACQMVFSKILGYQGESGSMVSRAENGKTKIPLQRFIDANIEVPEEHIIEETIFYKKYPELPDEEGN